MTDTLTALLAKAPGLSRASRLVAPRVPVLEPFEELLPDKGLRPGTTVGVTGAGATSLALALAAKASEDRWMAAVGFPSLSLPTANELGVDLDHVVVVTDPDKQWTAVLSALVDAFDVVLARPPSTRDARKLGARVREQEAVLLVVGRWPESDLVIEGTRCTWHGIGGGHGHLTSRTIDVTVTGRGAAARGSRASLWLPGPDGRVAFAHDTAVVPIRRTG